MREPWDWFYRRSSFYGQRFPWCSIAALFWPICFQASLISTHLSLSCWVACWVSVSTSFFEEVKYIYLFIYVVCFFGRCIQTKSTHTSMLALLALGTSWCSCLQESWTCSIPPKQLWPVELPRLYYRFPPPLLSHPLQHLKVTITGRFVYRRISQRKSLLQRSLVCSFRVFPFEHQAPFRTKRAGHTSELRKSIYFRVQEIC